MAPETEREGFAEPQNRYQESDRILKTDDPGTGPDGLNANLKARVVVGVFDRQEDAEATVQELERMGYPREDVSLVMQRPGSPAEIGTSATEANKGMTVGFGVGAVIGGIAGLAAMALPGVGAILAAGPLAALLGATTGVALGGLVGAFSGLGIPKDEAVQLDEAVRAGGLVVAVKAADREADQRACEVMQQHGVRRCGSYNQAL